MTLDAASLFVLLVVFVRCSAMFLASPFFSAVNIPVQVRVFTALSFAGALAIIVKPSVGPVPSSLIALGFAVIANALVGLLIGGMMHVMVFAAQMAGSLLDLEIGLGASEVLNPIQGVSVTILAQFKYMLATVVFLLCNAHHFLIIALVDSFAKGSPLNTLNLAALEPGIVALLGHSLTTAVQIAAPTLAVGIVVDASLGLINRAVPQMQALQVGMPAKLAAGIFAVSLSIPALVYGVTNGTGDAFNFIENIAKPPAVAQPRAGASAQPSSNQLNSVKR